jgi:SAM-dependent methyltransferase
VPNFDGGDYQARFDALADKGIDVHGEASLVLSFGPTSVLDAGCGTGRVAIELARLGVDVVGVDVDASMLAEARRRAPELEWVEVDLSDLALGRQFDVVVMAGNVPLFCPAPKRAALVEACSAHVAEGGVLVAGFELGRGYGLDDYDSVCLASELFLAERWATWDRQPFQEGNEYAVSVHRRTGARPGPIPGAAAVRIEEDRR